MLVTLQDGKDTRLFDTETKSMLPGKVHMPRHHLRLHVYDPVSKTATEKFVTYDKVLQNKIMAAIRSTTGYVDHSNSWIKPVIKRKEFFDVTREREIVLRDLRGYFGDAVSIRGTSKRYIYYISDGNMSSTPDAIGKMFRYPLVYKGYAMATIFDIDSLDPLSPGQNIVYWLTKPMWHRFHDRMRGIHKDFPWPTGFVATYWCQREGYGTYGKGGIRIASMTQGQTVGRWASTSLRQFWIERQGRDLLANFGKSYRLDPKKKDPADVHFAWLVAIESAVLPFGKVGLYCVKCGTPLKGPYDHCPKCGKSNNPSYGDNGTFCVKCGKAKTKICDCGDKYCAYSVYGCTCELPQYVVMKYSDHSKQYKAYMDANSKHNKGLKGGQYNVISY